ncbi:hypothetical protein Goari_010139 [Gossypium aridum]|uniref:Uncharacterized protein n=1 Tax=Gossypium aridum TaxID=34290 RepID=A0A7J8Y0Q6_GOSAI|nr:hypothetical protein [Gossypium aridum]
MKEFLMKVKSCYDNLASCGEVIGEHEHVTAILNGLSPEYESIFTIIIASQVVSCEVSNSANLVSHQSSESSNTSGSIPAYRPSSTA